MTDDDLNLLKGLAALSVSAFPKQCTSCGREYATVEDLVRHTQSIGKGKSIKVTEDDDGTRILELYRNCVCGSTLMDFCSERRDTSPKGLRRRLLFGKLLENVIAKGLVREVAREELLRVLHGEQSESLEKLGLEAEQVLKK